MDSTGTRTIIGRRKLWFKARTNTERTLLIGLGILTLFCLGLLILLIIIGSTPTEVKVCQTHKCISASARILSAMDLTTDPCNDFYQFVCGKFVRSTPIPEDRSSVNSFSLIRDKVQQQVKSLVEDEPLGTAPKQYHFVKKIFNMCMNATAIEADALPTAKSILQSVGGWPLLEGKHWDQNYFHWIKLMSKFRKLGVGTNFFIFIQVAPDLKNSSRNIITISEASLDLEREYLINGVNEPIIEAYYDYMVDLAVLFGANRDAAMTELKDTLDFEIKLARICSPQEETRNWTALYNPTTIKELQVKYPFMSWLSYITNTLNIPDIRLTEDEPVIVDVPQFIMKLDDLLRQTPKRVQANYLMRVVANNLVSSLGRRFRERRLQFTNVLNGQTQTKPRWQECLAVTRKIGRYPIEASYIRNYFNAESKSKVNEIVASIRSEFENRLHTLEWIDDVTKTNALEKIKAVNAFIGYPDELLDDKNVEEYYSKMDFNSDNYLQSMIDYSIFYSNDHYSKLRKPANRIDWHDHAGASTVNAFYSSNENSIILPAGILQDVFFEEGRPEYSNYGGIGSTIGHELIHGFDDEGSQYDKDGNLRDWWAQGTKNSFLKKSQCIIEQFSNYSLPEIGINVNGINTQGENIADLGGVILAYLAYQNWAKRNGPELPLPGLDFTPNQLFWISAGSIECETERLESRKSSVTSGSHSPGMYRVNGAYSNTEYFAKDFKCALGTKMNPVQKCSIW